LRISIRAKQAQRKNGGDALFPFIEASREFQIAGVICRDEKPGFRLEKCLGGFRPCRATTSSLSFQVDDDQREVERESYAKVWYASFSGVGHIQIQAQASQTQRHRIVSQVTVYGETSREVKKKGTGSSVAHTAWPCGQFYIGSCSRRNPGTVRPLGL
jgi:hypothetical protein